MIIKNSVLLLLLLLVSCSDSKKELMSDFATDFPQTEELTLAAQCDSLEIYNPRAFFVKDSLLFVLETGFDYLGRCFNLNTGQEVTKFVYKGKARSEMMGAHDLAPYGNDSLNLINLNTPQSIKTFCINDLLSGTEQIPSETIVPDSINSSSFIKTGNNKLFGLGGIREEDDGIIGKYFISKENKTMTFGDYNPLLYEANIEIGTREMNVMSGVFSIINPTTNKVATASTYGVLFEIIDLEKQKTENYRYYDKIKIKIVKEGDYGVYYEPVSTNIIRALAGNDKTISVIKATILPREKDKPKEYNENLLIFDWDLNPIKMYHIPKHERTLQYISQNGEFLYTLKQNTDDTYSLIKYNIQ